MIVDTAKTAQMVMDAMMLEALAEGIAKLLDDPGLREKFVKNLKKESFDNTKELQNIIRFHRKLRRNHERTLYHPHHCQAAVV